jgi:hypothetical protein
VASRAVLHMRDFVSKRPKRPRAPATLCPRAGMAPAVSYDEVCADLARSFRGQEPVPFEPRSTVRMVGLLFARPEVPFAASEIMPSITYYHLRSGHHINFYCAGFGIGWDVSRISDREILSFYSDRRFEEFRRDIESRCNWKYSGGADLLLTNAIFDGRDARLDFTSAITADLMTMKADGAITSVGWFFERIFRYAERQDGSDPTWGFSNQAAKHVAGSALKSLLISLLPKGLQEDIKRAFHFAVRDVSIQPRMS